jgi:hypothetical protein
LLGFCRIIFETGNTATAKVHGLRLALLNKRVFERLGVEIVES